MTESKSLGVDREGSTARTEAPASNPLPQVCTGCDHAIGMHFASVDGKVRCIVTEHYVSATGVIGLESTYRCDCVDYVSRDTLSQRAIAAKARAPFDRLREAWARAGHKPITLGEKK